MVSYLAAEYCRHSPEYDVVFDNTLTGGPTSAEKIYLDAAKQGCDLAHLWLAYCYEEGRCGLVKKPEFFASHLSQVSNQRDGLFSMDDLAFLYDALDTLYDLTEQALYLWDQYRDPCFSTLNDRSALLYGYMVMLGLRNVPRHERKSPLDVYNPRIEWNPAYDELNAKNSQEKADWEAWCKQHRIHKSINENQNRGRNGGGKVSIACCGSSEGEDQ